MNVAAGYRLRKYEYLLSLGNVAVFVYDYYGYGKSDGEANPDSAVAAARLAAKWFSDWTQAGWPNSTNSSATSPVSVDLTQRTMTLSKTVLLGESMGGTLTSRLAKVVNYDVAGLLYMATFLHLKRLSMDYFPMAGWALGGVVNSKYPDFNNEENINSGNVKVCRYHAHSPDDEWVKYSTNAPPLYQVPARDSSCSEFVRLEDGILHTQPLTIIQQQTMEAWFNGRRSA